MQVDSNSTSRKRSQAHVVAKGAGGLSWVSMVAGLPVAARAMTNVASMAASAKAVIGIAPLKGAKKAKKSPVPETQRAMQVDEQAAETMAQETAPAGGTGRGARQRPAGEAEVAAATAAATETAPDELPTTPAAVEAGDDRTLPFMEAAPSGTQDAARRVHRKRPAEEAELKHLLPPLVDDGTGVRMPRVVVARAAGGRRKGASPKVEFRLTPEREVFGKIICQELGFYKGVDNLTPGMPIILLLVRRPGPLPLAHAAAARAHGRRSPPTRRRVRLVTASHGSL